MKSDVNTLFSEGLSAHKNGNLSKAESKYKSVLETQPNHGDAHHNLGVLSIHLGKIDEAVNHFQNALHQNDRNSQFWCTYIKALIYTAQRTEAAEALLTGRRTGLAFKEADHLEQKLNNNISADTNDIPNTRVNELMTLFTKGDLIKALELGNKLATQFPDTPTIMNILGVVNFKLGNHKTCININKRTVQLKPDFAEAHNNLGFAHSKVGNKEQAIESYRQAIILQPGYAEAYNNIGFSFYRTGLIRRAMSCYNRAIQLKSDYVEALNNLGFALSVAGRQEEAIHHLNKAIELNPDFAKAHNNLGITFSNLGKHEEAIGSVKKSLELQPNDLVAHYNLGIALYTLGKYREAEEHFKFSSFNKSQNYLLRCLYLRGEKNLFYRQLNYLIDQGEVHPMIGSLCSRAALKYGKTKSNLFCNNPMSYVSKVDLKKKYDFDKIFVEAAQVILYEEQSPTTHQELLTNGQQTAGNLFLEENEFVDGIEKIIHQEINNYRNTFRGSEEGFIKHWPAKYALNGWLISMESGGTLKPHMHEEGWISGSIYINVPPKKNKNSGNLVVCIDNEETLTAKDKSSKKILDVATGDLCLFPASLLHYTIPFESEEKRIVLAFDAVPG
ncbi:MAG: hypothetical protein CMM58_07350 [Rhodospirillaceae bacterium]|nr:hypothetical protein [Rhodospirillaceae bacterium]|tara:strand:+ start:3034 stop:4875 length:1842 start_codon:yes stop_codon:yes gene_type:complete